MADLADLEVTVLPLLLLLLTQRRLALSLRQQRGLVMLSLRQWLAPQWGSQR